MPMQTLALPVPPLSLGGNWTGHSLLNWVVANADPQMKAALTAMRVGVGGDAFRALFIAKAEELNRMIAAQGGAGPTVHFCTQCGAIIGVAGLCEKHKVGVN